jgi:hypothetical protein
MQLEETGISDKAILGGQTGLFDIIARSWTSGFAGWLWVA